MNRQGYKEAVLDLFLYMLPVYLPFYQAMLLHGMGRAIVFLLVAVLLMFLVAQKDDIGGAMSTCLKIFPNLWITPEARVTWRELWIDSSALPDALALPVLFQRPPPLFA
jgi:hypothetical protein